MSLLSSWDEIDVCVELLADYVYAAEDYKTGLLNVVVDIFDQLYLKEQIEIWDFFDEGSKYYIWLYPPYGKTRKPNNVNQLI